MKIVKPEIGEGDKGMEKERNGYKSRWGSGEGGMMVVDRSVT